MSNGDTSIPKNIDVNVPSVARMYDYYLGGKDNYPADRVACEQLLEHVPSTKVLAVNNRRFLRRVVHHLASEYGIRQFIDHGSGLPTQDNVHQVAQLVDRDSRVVYIDNDPIVLAHGKAILEENDRTAVIQADMRDTEGIFGHPEVQPAHRLRGAGGRPVRLRTALHPRQGRPGRPGAPYGGPAGPREFPGGVPARERGRGHP